MELAEGMEVLRKCVDELEKRFIVNVSSFASSLLVLTCFYADYVYAQLGEFTVRIADKDGVRQVSLKTGEPVL